MSACNCCEEFPINVVTLEARSASQLNCKCGYPESNGNFDDDGNPCSDYQAKFYLQRTTTWTSDAEGGEGYYKIDVETNSLVQWNGEDVVLIETCEWNSNNCQCECSATGYIPEDYGNFDYPQTYSFLNEYNTNQLMSDTFNCLEGLPFTEWVPTIPTVSYPTSSRIFYEGVDGCKANSCYNETKAQFRISHPPTATGYLKVWLIKRTYTFQDTTIIYSPNEVVPDYEWINPVDSLLAPYIWSGEPQDLGSGINEPSNRIEGTPIDISRPSEQQLVEIRVLKWSLIEGYEPESPIFSNGFYQLSQEYPSLHVTDSLGWARTSPDCESNGVPTLNTECPFRE